jgi:polygalacturonase
MKLKLNIYTLYMKNKKLLLIGLLIISSFCWSHSAKAEIIVYHPPTITDIPVNGSYTVYVREVGESDAAWRYLRSYDAMVHTEQDQNIAPTHMSFVSFDADFAKNVEVKVTKTLGTVETVKIRPDSAGITAQKTNNVMTFTMTAAKKISLEVDGNIKENLFIFANEKEESLVDAMQGKTIKYLEPGNHPVSEFSTDGGNNFYYFKPGVHYINASAGDNGGVGTGYVYLDNNEQMHIPGGAYVYGAVQTTAKSNVVISGRGILSAGKFNHNDIGIHHQEIIIKRSTSVNIQDIIILNADGWNIDFYLSNNLVAKNVKIISWMWGTDGINPLKSSDVHIDDCLIRNNDDVISPKLAPSSLNNELDKNDDFKTRNVVVENSILWADRGRAIGFGPAGYNTTDSANRIMESVTFRNIDILRAQAHLFDETSSLTPYPQWSNGILSIVSNDDATIRNIVFDNIRIDALDNTQTSLINLWMEQTPTYGESDGKSISNIYFNDITLKGLQKRYNIIQSIDASHFVSSVHFRNLNINDNCVTSASGGLFNIVVPTQDVTFACDTTPFNTIINTHPTASTNLTTATFSFSANETATFKCSLDNGAYGLCTSPKAYNNLAQGAHTFSVKATNSVYHEDPTPAAYSWEVAIAPVNGTCGAAQGTYLATDTYWRTPACATGLPSPLLPWPFLAPGATMNWQCVGENGGTTASCSATRASNAIIPNAPSGLGVL